MNGPYLAQTLSSRLGYAVNQNEHFYTSGCPNTGQSVFPNALIPQHPWGNAPDTHAAVFHANLQGMSSLRARKSSTSTTTKTTHTHHHQSRLQLRPFWYFSIYYFNDKYDLDDPYPSGLGGATVPGNGQVFDAAWHGIDQTVALSNIHSFGAMVVNEARFGWTRLDNNIGIPRGGVAPRFANRIQAGNEGIVQGAPQQAGVEYDVLQFLSL